MLVKDSADFMDDITRTEVADFLYSTIVDNIADELREQEGMQNNNALIDLGDQVANGGSVYWDVYVKTVEDMTVKYLDRIPEKFLLAMWQDGRYIDNIVDDENDLDNILLHTDLAMEIFNRLCLIAEEEYDNYVIESGFDEEDE